VALRRHEDFEPEGYFVIKTVVTSVIDLNQSNQSLLAIDFPSSTEILFVVHRADRYINTDRWRPCRAER